MIQVGYALRYFFTKKVLQGNKEYCFPSVTMEYITDTFIIGCAR